MEKTSLQIAEKGKPLSGEALLIVDDEKYTRTSLRRLLKKMNLKILEAASGEEAQNLLQERHISVAIVDQMMPGMKGTNLLEWMKKNRPLTTRIMLTADPGHPVVLEAINKGEVFRFLPKPWDNSELIKVIGDSLDQYRQLMQFTHEMKSIKTTEKAHRIMKIQVEEIMKQLENHSEYIKAHKLAALSSLAEAVDARDPCTHGHQARVSEIACKLAKKLGMSGSEQETIRVAGLIHDIGKIGIPDEILFYEGRLNSDMWNKVKLHPEIGAKILDPVDYEWKIKDIVLQHHERFDGRGYPMGLIGDRISFPARILSVADSFDAMSSDRPYRGAIQLPIIIKEIENNKGKQFDPEIADLLISSIEDGVFAKNIAKLKEKEY